MTISRPAPTYIDSTLAIITNEGKLYQSFTDVVDGDAANITGSAITINMGNAASPTTGDMSPIPANQIFYGSTCIMVVSPTGSR